MEYKQTRGKPDQLADVMNFNRRHQVGDSPAAAALPTPQSSSNWQQNPQVVAGPSSKSPGAQNLHRQQQLQQQPRQQPSGETVSSFESDYDLLVGCLNEQTDTEDIVETEQSLDYQDQTWRQSICGGASLAPTIDGSLSELLGAGSRNHLEQDFDLLLMTPTPYGPIGSSSSNQNYNHNQPTQSRNSYASYNLPSAHQATSRSSQVTPTNRPAARQQQQQQQQVASQLIKQQQQRQQKQQQPEDECDREVLSVFHEPGQQKQANLTNKLASLFKSSNRQPEAREKSHTLGARSVQTNETQVKNYANQMRVPATSSQARGQQKTRAMATGGHSSSSTNTNDAAELDRLLVEMSQSLDLDSLAKFDTRPQQQQFQPQTGKLNYYSNQNAANQRANFNPQQYQVGHNSNGSSSKSATLAGGLLQNRGQSNLYHQQPQRVPLNTRIGSAVDLNAQRSQQITSSSHSSILDEYDGASRMLEQMISDQLRDGSSTSSVNNESPKSGQLSTASTRKLSTNSLTRQAKALAQNSASQSNKDDASLSSRKMSTCSSSQATETSVILASSRQPSSRKATTTPPLIPSGRGAVSKSTSSNSMGLPGPQTSSDSGSRQTRSGVDPMEKFRLLDPSHPSQGQLNNNGPQVVLAEAKPTKNQNLMQHRGQPKSAGGFLKRLSSNQRRNSDESPPPPPPAVDYDDYGASRLGVPATGQQVAAAASAPIEKVIQVSPACDSDSDSDASCKPEVALRRGQVGGDSRRKRSFPQVDRMRKSMRNMRDKFNNLISPEQQIGSQPQRSKLEISAPIPLDHHAKRLSSSVSGDDDRLTAEHQPQRQSRSSRRRNNEPNPNNKPAGGQQSLGQQIRERLSRSKNRLSKFLKPATKRAQSTPSKAPRIPVDSEDDDRRLFQPGDITRNSPVDSREITLRSTSAMGPETLRSDSSFDRSLDRHLAAKMSGNNRKASSSSSSSSVGTSLSGLETTSKGSATRKSKRSSSMRRLGAKDSPSSEKKRSTSLLSIKRLRSKRQASDKATEDLDEIKVITTDKSKRSKKNKRGVRSPASASTDDDSNLKLPKTEKTTDQYFGQVAPMEDLDTSDCQPGKLCVVQAPRGANSVNQTIKSVGESNETKPEIPTRNTPSRSQSMRQTSSTLAAMPSNGDTTDLKVKEVEPKASSTSNLTVAGLNRRELPEPTNSFRPMSACDIEIDKLKLSANSTAEVQPRDQVVTPIGPRRESPLHSSKDNLEIQKRQTAIKRSMSPLRSRGSAILGDFKTKCSEFFTSNGPNQSTNTTKSTTITEPTPRRPPRSRGRAKSMGPPVVEVTLAETLQPTGLSSDQLNRLDLGGDQVIHSVEPSSPTDSSLDPSINNAPGDADNAAHRPTTPVALAGRKLANFAQQLKHSATDFFNDRQQNGRGRSRTRGNRGDETTTAKEDLCRWSPVIKANNRKAPLATNNSAATGEQTKPKSLLLSESSDERRNQLAGKAREEPRNVKLDTLRQAERSLDLTNDSTWESATDDDDDDEVAAENARGDKTAIVQQQVAGNGRVQGADVAADESPLSNLKRQLKYDDDNNEATAAPNRIEREHRQREQPQKQQVALGAQTQNKVKAATSGTTNNAIQSPRALEQKAELKLAEQQAGAGVDEPVASEQQKQRAKQTKSGGQSDECKSTGQKISLFSPASGGKTTELDEQRAKQQQQEQQKSHQRISHSASAFESQPRENLSLIESSRDRDNKTSTGQREISGVICKTAFKFNENLPSPAQILSLKSEQREGDKLADEEMKYENLNAARQEEEEEKRKYTAKRFDTKQEDNKDTQQKTYKHREQREEMPLVGVQAGDEATSDDAMSNRLSVYENVEPTKFTNPSQKLEPQQQQHEQTTISAKESQSSKQPKEPESQQQASKKQSSSPTRQRSESQVSQNASDWNIDLSADGSREASQISPSVKEKLKRFDEQLAAVEREVEIEELERELHQRISKEKPEPTRPKLVAMTSLIQDPNDELMMVSASSAQTRQHSSGPSTPTGGDKMADNRRDSTFSITNDTNNNNNNNNNNNSDTDDSSFASASANRRRLVSRFEQQRQSPRPRPPPRPAHANQAIKAKLAAGDQAACEESDRASQLPPPPPRPSGSSLVKRLAKNFDQTAAEHQQQASGSRGRPPMVPRGGKQVVKTQVLPTAILADSFSTQNPEEEPKSESTWYDAKSVELLDDAEVAELLREFDNDGIQFDEPPARLPVSIEPVEEELVTSCSVSTGADPYVTVAESTLRSEEPNDNNLQIREATNDQQVDDDEEDDGSASSHDSDDAVMSDDNDDDTLNDEVGLMSNMEDDRTESYMSAAAAANTDSQIDAQSKHSTASSATQPKPETTAEIRTRSSIDTQFKNSLNDIIARRPSTTTTATTTTTSSSLSGRQSGDTTMTAPTTVELKVADGTQPKQQAAAAAAQNDQAAATPTNTQKCKQQLKGLTSYYKALIRRHKKYHHERKQKEAGDSVAGSERANGDGDETKVTTTTTETGAETGNIRSPGSSSTSSSTVSSSCPSEAEESDDEEVSTASSATNARLVDATDSRKLVRAAKKCSRLYDELEKILANRADQQGKLQVLYEDSTGGQNQDLDQQQQQLRPVSSELGEDDFFFEESLSLSLTDQTSLSSSSLSSESIPEIKLRHNLQKLYHIVNEIYTSERKFVDTLKLLNEDFRSLVSQAPCEFPLDCVNSLLKHLPHLQALNENLLDELKLARDQWPTSQKIAHVLVKIGPFLKHYSTYIREFESMQQQFQDNLKKYPAFAEKVKQFEAEDKSQNLTIQHHLLKPIQRIPQYRLLLQQYLHHLKPDDVDYEDTVNALEVVSRVAEHANQSMNDGANFAKLLALQAKIVGKRQDIVQPGRLLIKEGELMKVCRKQIQPRWFVLLNDALLYLTQIQSSDILYLNNELPLDDCLVSTPDEITSLDHLSDPSAPRINKHHQPQLMGKHFDREFTVSTRTKSFALVAKTRADRDEWVSVLRKTVDELNAKRRSFSQRNATIKTANSLTNDTQQQPNQSNQPSEPQPNLINYNQNKQQIELLGQRAPLWTPDSRVTMCQLCTRGFSALFRRHHCRACGRVVCSACSSNKAPLMYLKCRAARVCDECFGELKASIHLYYLPYTSNQQVGASEEELRRLDEHFRTLLKSQFKRQGTKSMKLGHFNSLLNQINHIMS